MLRQWSAVWKCLQAFWYGVTQPSFLSLLMTVFFTMLAFSVLCIRVRPESLAGKNAKILMTFEFDTHTAVTGKALAIHTAKLPAPNVVILGASTTRTAVGSEQHIAHLIKTASGHCSVVYNMCTDDQKTWEMAAIADYLTPQFQGALVLGVTPKVLSEGYASLERILHNPRLGFMSIALDEEARLAGLKVPCRTGVFTIDNRDFLLARRRAILRNVFTGGPTFNYPDTGWLKRINNPVYWDTEIADIPRIVDEYDRNLQSNLGVVERLSARFRRDTNHPIILMAAPINPRWFDLPQTRGFRDRYISSLKGFSDANEMVFLDISDEAELEASDFVDYSGHIDNPEAKARCAEILGAHVSQLLLHTATVVE